MNARLKEQAVGHTPLQSIWAVLQQAWVGDWAVLEAQKQSPKLFGQENNDAFSDQEE